MHQVAGGYTHVIICTKTTFAGPDPCVRGQADIPKWLSVQRQHLLILTHASGDRRIYPCDYQYKDNTCWSWPMRQVVGGYTHVIFRTKTTSVNLDPCVRWQTEIPQVVICTNTILLPQPMRGPVACRDTFCLSAHMLSFFRGYQSSFYHPKTS